MKFSIRDLLPKRRWFQFSLKTLLIVMTLFATAAAWWKHRSICLEKCQIHLGRNAGYAKKIFRDGYGADERVWPAGAVIVSLHHPEQSAENWWDYRLEPRTKNGYRRWVITVELGTLPAEENRIKTELNCEGDKADQYFHAIWRPWEILWIDETPPPESSL